MKNIMKIVLLGAVACFVWMNGVGLYTEKKNRICSDINNCFRDAVSNDFTMRWKEANLPTFHHVSTKKTNDSIIIESQYGSKKVPPFERTMPEGEKYSSILQTALRYENPINANTLDSIYRIRLKEQNLIVETAVCYTDKISGKVHKSNKDTSFYKKAYVLPPVVTGIEKEIVLQAFADITFFSVIRSSIRQFVGWGILYIIFLFLVVSLLYKQSKRIVTISGSELLEKGDVEIQIADNLILNTELHVLKHGESTVSLTDQSVSLLKLFLSHKDYFVSNDDIRQHLWGPIDYSVSRRNQAIKRLRDSLKDMPFLRVENVRGTGFRLEIDDEKTI